MVIFLQVISYSAEYTKYVSRQDTGVNVCLGSGLVIFKGRKTGYAGGHGGVPCVPCFIFPKVS